MLRNASELRNKLHVNLTYLYCNCQCVPCFFSREEGRGLWTLANLQLTSNSSWY